MQYALLLGGLLAMGVSPSGQAQCVVKQDTNQLVTTTCVTTINRARTYVTVTRVYKGSPYLTFPIWQKGTVQLEAHSTPISCSIEFNLVNNQVYCEVQAGKLLSVMPYQFTVQDRTFINYPTKMLGRQLPAYYELLHRGKINLLVQRKRILQSAIKTMDVYQTQPSQYSGPNGEYNGSYEDTVQYYLQGADSGLKAVELTSQSLLKALPASATFLKSRLSAQPLTVDKVVEALTFYESNSASQ